MHRQQTFTAIIKISGINPYVDVPRHVMEGLGAGVKAPVLMKITARDAMKRKASAAPKKSSLARDAARLKAIARLGPGGWFRTTLVPSRSTGTRLYLDRWMREAAAVGGGDRVEVTLKPDRAPRELLMPVTLRKALKANPRANAAWQTLAPSRRREILTYLDFLKTPVALERNVQKTITTLLAERRLKRRRAAAAEL